MVLPYGAVNEFHYNRYIFIYIIYQSTAALPCYSHSALFVSFLDPEIYKHKTKYFFYSL